MGQFVVASIVRMFMLVVKVCNDHKINLHNHLTSKYSNCFLGNIFPKSTIDLVKQEFWYCRFGSLT